MRLPCSELTGLFFSFRADDIATAKAICAGCPVADGCLEDALSIRYAYQDGGGVWAGTIPSERRAIRRARAGR